ncbi:MAG: 2-oxoglutarate and iron-dependent oxygenase domain-containing protein, partial [Bacteroidetes bacterium]|nr:2-oxoglutarate and iron-dependent oxygenase domain-containing protein [Bacteroidota bacterium]
MEKELLNEVPSLDPNDFTAGNPEKKAQFVADLGAAFNTIGFVAIKNHGLTEEMRTQLYEQ